MTDYLHYIQKLILLIIIGVLAWTGDFSPKHSNASTNINSVKERVSRTPYCNWLNTWIGISNRRTVSHPQCYYI
jgi:hypothetical protein